MFVTNHLKLAALTVAAIYRDRWQIELFFKAIKQSLRIKTFVGTSPNAVMIQIWTALIAMLLLRYLQLRATYDWSLSNLVALLRSIGSMRTTTSPTSWRKRLINRVLRGHTLTWGGTEWNAIFRQRNLQALLGAQLSFLSQLAEFSVR